jgi:paraquat-inducible protein B
VALVAAGATVAVRAAYGAFADDFTVKTRFARAGQGLRSGSDVKFRGVNVGNVSKIAVAPDRRHVQVSYDLDSVSAQRLALDKPASERSQLGTALRAQLGSMGVTGVKYVALDLFDDRVQPDQLTFDPAPHYVPTQPSTLKNIEAAVTDASRRLPEVTERLIGMLDRINGVLDSVNEQAIPKRASDTLGRLDQVLAVMQVKLEQFKSAELSEQSRATLAQLQNTVSRVDRLLERVDGQSGVLANAERASLSMGDAARNATHIGTEAERTLREIGEAASAVRELADALERQPDMLLKGRARPNP